ncbi:MAG: phosphoglycerate mutase [Dictyoglomus sp. NZ13-RE01]|nr:MAG: phosphoglycerate mutase [Dictyoglomus sp. NZ13-RE01]
MMEIFLIRHGETDWNREGRYQGRTDVPLNERGKRQAQVLAEFLYQEGISLIFSSSLKRAIETAKPLAEKLNLDIKIRDNWIEYDFGEWEGLTIGEVISKYPEISKTWVYNTEKAKIPGGEDFLSAYQRIEKEKEFLLSNFSNEKIAIFTHGAIIRIAISVFLEIKSLGVGRLTISSCSVNHFKTNRDNRLTLVKLNYLYPHEIFSDKINP